MVSAVRSLLAVSPRRAMVTLSQIIVYPNPDKPEPIR
jgi:hypothetical protein